MNPCRTREVTSYLAAIKREQALAGRVPQQARPVLSPLLKRILTGIAAYLARPDLSDGERFLALRNAAQFALGYWASQRARDIHTTLSDSVLRLPPPPGAASGAEVFVFNQTDGKTLASLRSAGPHVFGIARNLSEPQSCPIAWLEAYVGGARAMGIELAGPGRFLFCPWMGSVTATAAASAQHLACPPSQLTTDLRTWLGRLGVAEPDSYSFHGFRGGNAIDMLLSGKSLDDVMRRGHWKTAKMALHYTKTATVMFGGGTRPLGPMTPAVYEALNSLHAAAPAWAAGPAAAQPRGAAPVGRPFCPAPQTGGRWTMAA